MAKKKRLLSFIRTDWQPGPDRFSNLAMSRRSLCNAYVMFWVGLLANNWGVFSVKRFRFRSGVPDGSRVGWCSCIAVRVACRLLCQLFHHVQHQLCHVDGARTNPHHRGDYLLLNGRHAFTYLPDFLDQVFSRCN